LPGLILYSPLVVLGALGVVRLWRQDRWLIASLVSFVALLTLVAGASTYWGDELWGPRYVVPAAWTLLVPIAWWCDTTMRKRVLIAVAVAAFAVQVVAVSAYYGQYVPVAQQLTGVQIYTERYGTSPEDLPFGIDPPRWVPELSPLLMQSEGLLSSQVLEPLGGKGLTLTYHPFEGRSRSVNLSEPGLRTEADFFWSMMLRTFAARAAALLLLLLALASGYGLYLLARMETPMNRSAPS